MIQNVTEYGILDCLLKFIGYLKHSPEERVGGMGVDSQESIIFFQSKDSFSGYFTFFGVKFFFDKLANIKKKIGYDSQWENSPQETKMTQKLTIVGHRKAFSDEKSPYRIVSYKRPRNNNVKQFKWKKTTALFMHKIWTNNKYVTHKQTTTTDLQAFDLKLRNFLYVLFSCVSYGKT